MRLTQCHAEELVVEPGLEQRWLDHSGLESDATDSVCRAPHCVPITVMTLCENMCSVWLGQLVTFGGNLRVLDGWAEVWPMQLTPQVSNGTTQ